MAYLVAGVAGRVNGCPRQVGGRKARQLRSANYIASLLLLIHISDTLLPVLCNIFVQLLWDGGISGRYNYVLYILVQAEIDFLLLVCFAFKHPPVCVTQITHLFL